MRQTDPYQMHNLFNRNHSETFWFSQQQSLIPPKSTRLTHLLSRLDSLVLVLKTCKTKECTQPWEVLHPKGDVKDLHDALQKQYDEFYEVQQERVSFSRCEKGYILESEGAIGARAFNVEEIGARGGSRWSELV
jgi:N-acetylglucosamine-6-sulfatase